MKPQFEFILQVNAVNDKIEDGSDEYRLEIIPKKETLMPTLILKITKEQYDAMRFHFMSAIDAKKNLTRFSYIS